MIWQVPMGLGPWCSKWENLIRAIPRQGWMNPDTAKKLEPKREEYWHWITHQWDGGWGQWFWSGAKDIQRWFGGLSNHTEKCVFQKEVNSNAVKMKVGVVNIFYMFFNKLFKVEISVCCLFPPVRLSTATSSEILAELLVGKFSTKRFTYKTVQGFEKNLLVTKLHMFSNYRRIHSLKK